MSVQKRIELSVCSWRGYGLRVATWLCIIVGALGLSACELPRSAGGWITGGQQSAGTRNPDVTPPAQTVPDGGGSSYPVEHLPPAPYELGHVVAVNDTVYREFWGMTEQGYYIVQDFYQGGVNRTELYIMTRLDEMNRLLLEDTVAITHQYAALIQSGVGIEGPYTQWYANGNKAIEGHYERNLPQGQWTVWYEDGHLMLQETLVDGVRTGEAKGWHTNGRLAGQGNYSDGVRQGVWTVWYPNGSKLQEGNYENGQQQGAWTFWYDNGRRKEAGDYNQGVRVGPWSWWTSDGQLVREADYGTDGQLQSSGQIGSGTIQPRNY